MDQDFIVVNQEDLKTVMSSHIKYQVKREVLTDAEYQRLSELFALIRRLKVWLRQRRQRAG